MSIQMIITDLLFAGIMILLALDIIDLWVAIPAIVILVFAYFYWLTQIKGNNDLKIKCLFWLLRRCSSMWEKYEIYVLGVLNAEECRDVETLNKWFKMAPSGFVRFIIRDQMSTLAKGNDNENNNEAA